MLKVVQLRARMHAGWSRNDAGGKCLVSGYSSQPRGPHAADSCQGAQKPRGGVEGNERETTMRLNGWQRLWLLASLLWAVAILALAGMFQAGGGETVPSASVALLMVRLWVVPVAAVYGFGLGLAWVRRGFQGESN